MTATNIKKMTVGVTTLLLLLSFTQKAIVTSREMTDGIQTNAAYAFEFFLGGALAFLGGGIFEAIIWSANPLCLIAVIFLFKNNIKAKVLSSIALALAISFRFWKEILASESGSTATIISFEPGYYLWVLSILILCAGIFLYFKCYEDELAITKDQTNS